VLLPPYLFLDVSGVALQGRESGRPTSCEETVCGDWCLGLLVLATTDGELRAGDVQLLPEGRPVQPVTECALLLNYIALSY